MTDEQQRWIAESDGGMLYLVEEPSRRVIALFADDGRAITEGLAGTVEDVERIIASNLNLPPGDEILTIPDAARLPAHQIEAAIAQLMEELERTGEEEMTAKEIVQALNVVARVAEDSAYIIGVKNGAARGHTQGFNAKVDYSRSAIERRLKRTERERDGIDEVSQKGWARVHDLEPALKNLLKRYVDLASSGDCGNWDPEEEEEVKAARKVLPPK